MQIIQNNKNIGVRGYSFIAISLIVSIFFIFSAKFVQAQSSDLMGGLGGQSQIGSSPSTDGTNGVFGSGIPGASSVGQNGFSPSGGATGGLGQSQLSSSPSADGTNGAFGSGIQDPSASGQYGINPQDGAIGSMGSKSDSSSFDTGLSNSDAAGMSNPYANSGASSANANGSNNGTKAAPTSATADNTKNTGACVGGAMLSRLLTSSISTVISKLSGNVASKATSKVAETATKVPVSLDGTQVARNNESKTNAETGMFLFGVQTGVSWDSVAYCIVNTIIDYIVNATIAWANSGFKGNPAFIRNPTQFFQQLADREASSFIQELAYNSTGLNVCQPFRVTIATGLQGSYKGLNNYSRFATCSLTQMQQNMMKSKYTITTPTDWLALTQPQNNIYYSYISAGDELSKRVTAKNNTVRFDLTINRGFLSKKKCLDDTKPESKTNPCDTTTPGSIIADSLSQTLNIPKERLVSAQKFDQMVDAIVNNLIKIALGDVLTKVTGQAPSQAVASDYYTQVTNNVTGSTGVNGLKTTSPTGPIGSGGTTASSNGNMMQQILNGVTFSNADWNAYALQQINASGIVNIQVSDAATFFPGGYPTAEGYLSIMAAIAQRESGGQAAPKRYLETKIGDGSSYSVGLMSLSQGDLEAKRHGFSYTDLENPYNNITVTVEIFARLLNQFHVISGPPSRNYSAGTGLSAYWSTFKF